MGVEFRQRTLGEYAQILWNSKWLILLPTLAITIAVAWVVYRLPNLYESTTLVVVKPPTIPQSVVPSLSDVDITLRLNTITQVVMSRTTLQPLIERYRLYQAERARGESPESLVEQMRRDIHVEVDHSRNDIANAFRISYRGPDPKAVQQVTAELAGQYTRAQTNDVSNTASQTKEFFRQQMEEAKQRLDELDNQRLNYMKRNVGNLPSESAALIGQLSSLREKQRDLITDIGRMRDQRTTLTTQLGEVQKLSEQDRMDIVENITDPKSTPAYAELVKRKSELEAQYQSMLTTLKPKNPDVLQKKAEIDSVKREMDSMIAENKAKVEEKRKRFESRSDPRLISLNSNLKLLDGEIARQQKTLDQSDGQVADLERRLNSVPGAEVDLDKLNRDYQTQKTLYDSLSQNEQRANIASDVATNQQGETIQVIDPASLPDRPVAPKRERLVGLGLALGLMVGLLLAAIKTIPRLLTIQTSRDAEHYTGLPVLAAVPQLFTPREKTRLRMRRTAIALASVIVTLVSIPALIVLFKLTRVFERFVA